MTLTEGEKLCFGYVYDMIAEVDKMPDLSRKAAPGKIMAGRQCPYCGKPILDSKWSYHCEGYKTDCNFNVNKADGKFTEKHLDALLKKGRTCVIKNIVHSQKTGKDYDASIVLEPKGSQYATKIKFPKTDQENPGRPNSASGSGNSGSRSGTRGGARRSAGA